MPEQCTEPSRDTLPHVSVQPMMTVYEFKRAVSDARAYLEPWLFLALGQLRDTLLFQAVLKHSGDADIYGQYLQEGVRGAVIDIVEKPQECPITINYTTTFRDVQELLNRSGVAATMWRDQRIAQWFYFRPFDEGMTILDYCASSDHWSLEDFIAALPPSVSVTMGEMGL